MKFLSKRYHAEPKIADLGRSPVNEWLEDKMLLIPNHLLSSANHPTHLTTLLPLCPILQLHYPVRLSHLAGDVNDSGQGLKEKGMQTFLERMNWADPSLVFPSLVPSACEGLGLGREEVTSGTAWIFAREGRRNSQPNNQEVGSLHRTLEGRKKHWEKNSAYLRARHT